MEQVREEMQALRVENAKLADAVRKYAEENEACMVLVRALRDVNADLDEKLLRSRELVGVVKVIREEQRCHL
jgi:pilus assembly protein TadC